MGAMNLMTMKTMEMMQMRRILPKKKPHYP